LVENIENNVNGGLCSTYGGEKLCIEVWPENLGERVQLEYQGVDDRIILDGSSENAIGVLS
jgi:hypothetical protein